MSSFMLNKITHFIRFYTHWRSLLGLGNEESMYKIWIISQNQNIFHFWQVSCIAGIISLSLFPFLLWMEKLFMEKTCLRNSWFQRVNRRIFISGLWGALSSWRVQWGSKSCIFSYCCCSHCKKFVLLNEHRISGRSMENNKNQWKKTSNNAKISLN